MTDIRHVTLHTGERIPRLGLGTWRMGGNGRPDYSRDEETVQAIQTALRLGLTHVDTAEGYAAGHSEELTGRALRDFKREDVFVATKVSPYDSGLRYNQVLAALPKSLKRLGLDYVDLYMIHWPDSGTPLAETFRALNELQAQGLARHIGVSNFDLALLQQAQELCATPILANQAPYSLFQREYVNNGVLDYCQQHGVLLVAYTPVEIDKVLGNPVVREIAATHNVTPVQIALNWLIRQPQVITIPKSVKEAHLRENVGAYEVELSGADVARLNRLA